MYRLTSNERRKEEEDKEWKTSGCWKLISRGLGTTYILEVYRPVYALESYSSPVSETCILLLPSIAHTYFQYLSC